MATITPVTYVSTIRGANTPPALHLRSGVAQANTGQTDWVSIPSWARFAIVYFNLTANAGTTPVSTLNFLAPPPGILDDANVMTLHSSASITAASQHAYNIGPGVTGIANGTDSATADANVGINVVLPGLLGVQLVLDRADTNETYTYTLSMLLRN
jgi:hypothetical protein